ncbi:hypothetical protein FGO68_gene13320 [Halteria grandinella]|uniref:Uncharacterized protein n=1 Tax=Halteria grandinella TaxID=5974 RepID=A0A8J8P7S7_HALGN|nr:hypothetical protein FGO68_gene13320 [Halteria grandinella]
MPVKPAPQHKKAPAPKSPAQKPPAQQKKGKNQPNFTKNELQCEQNESGQRVEENLQKYLASVADKSTPEDDEGIMQSEDILPNSESNINIPRVNDYNQELPQFNHQQPTFTPQQPQFTPQQPQYNPEQPISMANNYQNQQPLLQQDQDEEEWLAQKARENQEKIRSILNSTKQITQMSTSAIHKPIINNQKQKKEKPLFGAKRGRKPKNADDMSLNVTKIGSQAERNSSQSPNFSTMGNIPGPKPRGRPPRTLPDADQIGIGQPPAKRFKTEINPSNVKVEENGFQNETYCAQLNPQNSSTIHNQPQNQPNSVTPVFEAETKQLAALAGKSIESLDEMERLADSKFKSILARFKKAVKCIIQSVIQTQAVSNEQQTMEAIEASNQALEFLQREIFKFRDLFSTVINYKMPSFDGSCQPNENASKPFESARTEHFAIKHEPQQQLRQQSAQEVCEIIPACEIVKVQKKKFVPPVYGLQMKQYQVRDECNLPIIDFAGLALCPTVLNDATENLLILNRDLFEYKIEEGKKVTIIQPIFQFKQDPKFFLLHKGNVITESGIYAKTSPVQKYVDDEKYIIEQEFSDVVSGVPMTEDCILLSHQPRPGNQAYLSFMAKKNSNVRYAVTSHQKHTIGPIKLLSTISSPEQGEIITGVADNQLYMIEVKEDPSTLQDGTMSLQCIFNNDSGYSITDYKILSYDWLIIQLDSNEVITIQHPFTPQPQIHPAQTVYPDMLQNGLIAFLANDHPNIVVTEFQESSIESQLNMLDLVNGQRITLKTAFDGGRDDFTGKGSSIKIISRLVGEKHFGYILAARQKSGLYSETQLVVLDLIAS